MKNGKIIAGLVLTATIIACTPKKTAKEPPSYSKEEIAEAQSTLAYNDDAFIARQEADRASAALEDYSGRFGDNTELVRKANPRVKTADDIKPGTRIRLPKMPVFAGEYPAETRVFDSTGQLDRLVCERTVEAAEGYGHSLTTFGVYRTLHDYRRFTKQRLVDCGAYANPQNRNLRTVFPRRQLGR
jgi:hypothetical protein